MNILTFNKGQGGIGTPLPGLDYVSGLLFYSATLPSGFSSGSRIKIVYSVEEAEALGITDASLGETKSTATYQVTNKGAAGDTMVFTCATIASTSPIPADATAGTVTLASYTQVTADVTTVNTAATRLAAEINLGTPTHGFTAAAVTDTVTITAAAGQGVFLNSGTPYVATIVGTLAGTLTQNVVPGVASEIDIMYYHISEFFRMQPKGKLYVGIYATADVGTFSNITDMQTYAEGAMRQIGVYYKSTAMTDAHSTTCQAIGVALAAVYRPIEILLGGDLSATTASALPNKRLLSAYGVSTVIGQDGAAKGFKLFKATAKSIGSIGLAVGTVALAAVNEDIAWVGKFNLSDGTEMETPALSTGELIKSLSTGSITNTDNFGYIFVKKEIDYSGSFWNDSHTNVAITSDYAYIERNRAINKAIRGMRTYIVPELGRPLVVDTDGKLSVGVASNFESLAQKALDQMTNALELSAAKASVNSDQDVVSTSTITIVVQLIPTGTARRITVNVGFTTSITN